MQHLVGAGALLAFWTSTPTPPTLHLDERAPPNGHIRYNRILAGVRKSFDLPPPLLSETLNRLITVGVPLSGKQARIEVRIYPLGCNSTRLNIRGRGPRVQRPQPGVQRQHKAV